MFNLALNYQSHLYISEHIWQNENIGHSCTYNPTGEKNWLIQEPIYLTKFDFFTVFPKIEYYIIRWRIPKWSFLPSWCMNMRGVILMYLLAVSLPSVAVVYGCEGWSPQPSWLARKCGSNLTDQDNQYLSAIKHDTQINQNRRKKNIQKVSSKGIYWKKVPGFRIKSPGEISPNQYT